MLGISLEQLFRTPAQMKVLRVLFRAGKPLTGRQVQKLAGLANLTAMQSLKRLTDLGILSCRRAGRAYQCELKRDHWAVESFVSPLFENEEKGIGSLCEFLAGRLRGKCLSAYLYGSAVTDQTGAVGDLDLFLVVDKKVERTALESGSLLKLGAEVSRRFGVFLEPKVVSRTELSRKGVANLAQKIARSGRRICGKNLDDIISG